MLWILLTVAIIVISLLFWRWWSWPGLDEWMCGNVTWMDVSANRASLQMHQSAVERAIKRHNRSADDHVEFLCLARPPLSLFIRRFTLFRTATWAVVKTSSDRKLLFLKGWFTSDSVVPEFFDI